MSKKLPAGIISPLLLIAIGLIFGIAATVAYFQFRPQTKPQPISQSSPNAHPAAQSPSPKPSSADETANWKTFTDTNAKISFKYPSHWQITSHDLGWHFSNTDCNQGSYENMGNCSSLDYRIGGGDPRPTTPGLREKQFNGISFYERQGYADEGVVQTVAYFANGKVWYSIALNLKEDGTSEKILDQILSTFRFL